MNDQDESTNVSAMLQSLPTARPNGRVGGALEPAAILDDHLDHGGDRTGVLPHLVSARAQQRERVRREAALDADCVRQPLMVEPRRVDGLLRVHPEVDDVEKDLQHRGGNARAARPPSSM